MRQDERKIYEQALSDYSNIIRAGCNSIGQIEECIKILENFEDYEKCKDLLEILKAHQSKNKE
jgi:hypothetical protein